MRQSGTPPWAYETAKGRVKARLWLDNDFVDVYFNSEKGTISYAYIERGRRIFAANNFRIGWHLHPFP
mgnify:CR=1 FL=1